MGTEGDLVVDWWSSSIPQARECVLPDVLRRHAERQPDKVFAAFADGSTWTYAQTCTAANVVARDLADRGVGKGDHVLSWCSSVADMIRVWFGANQIGAVYVPLNPNACKVSRGARSSRCGRHTPRPTFAPTPGRP
jgi:crotonobetaine/carnitine-CoA ligase